MGKRITKEIKFILHFEKLNSEEGKKGLLK